MMPIDEKEIERLADLHLVCDEDGEIYGVEAFVRAVERAACEATLWQCKDVNGAWQWITKETYDQLSKEGGTVRALSVVEQQAGRIDAR